MPASGAMQRRELSRLPLLRKSSGVRHFYFRCDARQRLAGRFVSFFVRPVTRLLR